MAGQIATDDEFAGRVWTLMAEHGVRNPHALAVELGLKESCARVYSWTRGRSVPGYESIRAILTRYPDVDARWLLGCEEDCDE